MEVFPAKPEELEKPKTLTANSESTRGLNWPALPVSLLLKTNDMALG